MAGCTSGGDSEDPTDTTDDPNGGGTGAPVDATFVCPINAPVDEAVYNPFAFFAGINHMGGLRAVEASYEILGRTRVDDTREGWIIDETRAEDGTAYWKLRENYTWTDGDPVTAEDLAAKFSLNHYEMLLAGDVTFENVRVEDDYTVAYDLTDPNANSELHFGEWMGFNAHVWPRLAFMDVKADVFAEWTEQLDDATNDDEVESIWNDFMEWSLPLDEAPRNGPFDYAGDIGGRVHRYVPHEEYPGLAHIGGPEYPMEDVDWELHMRPYSDSQVEQQALRSRGDDELDIARIASLELYNSLLEDDFVPWPADIEDLQEEVNLFGSVRGYFFNWNREPLDDRLVRKAIMHAVPNSFGARAYGEGYIPAEYACGLPLPVAESWLGAQWMEDNLEHYGVEESNVERAEELLDQAGMTKDGDLWTHSDGSNWTLELKTSTDEIRVSQGQVATDELNQFGIRTEMTAVESSVLNATVYAEGDYDIGEDAWGAIGHPYQSFDGLVQNVPAAQDGSGDAPRQTELWPVPMPIGDPAGDIEMINMREEVDMLRIEGEDTQERVRLIAWAINQAVPFYPWSWGYRAQPPVTMVDGTQWRRPDADNRNFGFGSISEYTACQAKWGIEPVRQ